MKIKTLLAAGAAALTMAALPAAASPYDGFRGSRGGGDIVVRHDAGEFRFDPRDREYRRLVRDFGFRPGFRYQYTHACNGYGCDVWEYAPNSRRAVNRFRAPYFRFAFNGNRVPGHRS